MKRRRFGLLAGTGLTAVAAGIEARPAAAATTLAMPPPVAQDPSLLKSTLTPMGSLRAGNADGSIPAWTGGYVLPPVGPDVPHDLPAFADDKVLYTVNAANMAQYDDLLSEGTKALMTKAGFSMQVYPTHRSHALPQYVYDFVAENVGRAKLEPKGGRFGFTDAYGGYPFPIIDTSAPLDGGAQLIWNHLCNWSGFQETAGFASAWVSNGGKPINVYGGSTWFNYQFYDPNGSLEKYDGYYNKFHGIIKQPPSSNGQESLVWSSSNVLVKPTITWAVVAGQGRVRKAPDENFDTPDPITDGVANYDDSSGFNGNPVKYNWKLLGKKEMLIPYNCNEILLHYSQDIVGPRFPNPDLVRWEKHRVWVVEATLVPGERNVSARRVFYFDEDTYIIVLVDCYDGNNTLVKHIDLHMRCDPLLPGQIINTFAVYNMLTLEYVIIGNMKDAGRNTWDYYGPLSGELFDPQQMAASASF